MLLFRLKRRIELESEGNPSFDSTHGFIISAESGETARKIAADYRNTACDGKRRDESADIWLAETTTCERIGVADIGVSYGVILEDHRWG